MKEQNFTEQKGSRPPPPARARPSGRPSRLSASLEAAVHPTGHRMVSRDPVPKVVFWGRIRPLKGRAYTRHSPSRDIPRCFDQIRILVKTAACNWSKQRKGTADPCRLPMPDRRPAARDGGDAEPTRRERADAALRRAVPPPSVGGATGRKAPAAARVDPAAARVYPAAARVNPAATWVNSAAARVDPAAAGSSPSCLALEARLPPWRVRRAGRHGFRVSRAGRRAGRGPVSRSPTQGRPSTASKISTPTGGPGFPAPHTQHAAAVSESLAGQPRRPALVTVRLGRGRAAPRLRRRRCVSSRPVELERAGPARARRQSRRPPRVGRMGGRWGGGKVPLWRPRHVPGAVRPSP